MQTIAEAFNAWTNIEAQLAGTDDDTFNRLSAEMARIERAAVLLPVRSAQDVFQLLAMTTDDSSEPTEAAEELFRRARVEAAPKEAAETTLASIFARWLPLARKSAEGRATEAEITEDLNLVDAAAALPAVEPLDIWRKVAMAFDVTDHRHAGAAAALMQEARAALGIPTPTRH